MACDATARLYDVDHDSVVFKKLEKTERYDQGMITFRARKGRLVDLDKLHESIWATRLSGGTRSGLVSLDVTAIGKVVISGDQTFLEVSGSDAKFLLQKHPDEEHADALRDLQKAAVRSTKEVRVTGRIDNYKGRWPSVLQQRPSKPRQILVSHFKVME